MQQSLWLTWKKFLLPRSLLTPVLSSFDKNSPAALLIGQLMTVGFLFMKAFTAGNTYQARMETLIDKQDLGDFRACLQEPET